MARPSTSKSQKIRTGNYYLSWSALYVTLAKRGSSMEPMEPSLDPPLNILHHVL